MSLPSYYSTRNGLIPGSPHSSNSSYYVHTPVNNKKEKKGERHALPLSALSRNCIHYYTYNLVTWSHTVPKAKKCSLYSRQPCAHPKLRILLWEFTEESLPQVSSNLLHIKQNSKEHPTYLPLNTYMRVSLQKL